nr:hypothetical protein [Salinispora sp. H7-4]
MSPNLADAGAGRVRTVRSGVRAIQARSSRSPADRGLDSLDHGRDDASPERLRQIVEHWPRVDQCPVCCCGWPCRPTSTAYDYLTSVGQGCWVPSARSRARR